MNSAGNGIEVLTNCVTMDSAPVRSERLMGKASSPLQMDDGL